MGKPNNDDLDILFKGSQLSHRISAKIDIDSDSNSSDESSDEDYDPLMSKDMESNIFDSMSHCSMDLNSEFQDLLNESQENGENFLDEVLPEFRKLNNKHDCSNVDSTDLVNNFLKTEKKAMNLLHEELNILCELTLTYTGVKMYNKSWNKMKKVQTLMANLHKMDIPDVSSVDNQKVRTQKSLQPKSLFKICKHKLLP